MDFTRGVSSKYKDRTDLMNLAPHKPVLILAVSKMFTEGKYTTGDSQGVFRLSNELVDYFNKICEIINTPKLEIRLPVFHLQNDNDEDGNKFWFVSYNPGGEYWNLNKPPSSKKQMFEQYYGVRFGNLTKRLQDPTKRLMLVRSIISKNFKGSYVDELEKYVIENMFDFPRVVGLPSGMQGTVTTSYKVPDFSVEKWDGIKEMSRRTVHERKGQKKFRDLLLNAYDSTCCVTGCQVETALQAAHILPYRDESSNHIQNGLLLRSDIHALYDSGELVIDPDTYWAIPTGKIRADSEYSKQMWKKITLPSDLGKDPMLNPSKEALNLHREIYTPDWV